MRQPFVTLLNRPKNLSFIIIHLLWAKHVEFSNNLYHEYFSENKHIASFFPQGSRNIVKSII